jgi:tagaturonate reductase
MTELPRLSRELVSTLAFGGRTGIEVPPPATLGLPEKIVQFGTGAFLRGFVEAFVDEANRRGELNGSIVAVASTESRRDTVLNEQDGLYTLVVQGREGSAARQRYRIVSSLSRAIPARKRWDEVLALAHEPAIEIVVSNTTELGITFDPDDSFDARPPRSFPGKLTRFLVERALAFDYAERAGLVVLPCELIDDNGALLGEIVRRLAREWKLGPRFFTWLDRAVIFCNTLVDRIVPGAPSADEARRVARVFGYRDGLLTSCEPYALFAIEGNDALRARLGFANDPRVVVAPDIRPYRERKIRVLNGAHTITVPAALLAGLETVRDAVRDERVGRFMRRAIFDEIVPGLAVPDAESFAVEVLERFANPYVRHALIDITLHGTTKMRVRVVPSILAYQQLTGRPPTSLAFGFAAYLAFMRGEIQAERRAAGSSVPEDPEGDRVRAVWLQADLRSDQSLIDLAQAVCADTTLWSADLTALEGFAELVGEHLVRIVRRGVRTALDTHLTEAIALT